MMADKVLYSSNFPVYQVDFSAASCGKSVAATKRKICWRFGFPSTEAISSGKNGTDCRGSEHELVLSWSITSGKRFVTQDGREIHFSMRKDSKFDFCWNMGAHNLKITAHAAPPLSPRPGFKQFDFSMDGRSFFEFPRIFELGGTSVVRNDYERHEQVNRSCFAPSPESFTRSSSIKTVSTLESTCQVEQIEDLLEKNHHDDLLDRVELSSEMLLPAMSMEGYGNSSSLSQAQAQNCFDPAQQQPPTFQYISSEILSAYNSPQVIPSTINAPCVEDQVQYPSASLRVNTNIIHTDETPERSYNMAPQSLLPNSCTPTSTTSIVNPAQSTFSFETFQEKNSMPETQNAGNEVDDVNSVFKRLVNIDDINSPVMTDSLLATKPVSQNRRTKNHDKSSRGIPPKGTSYGNQQSLSQMNFSKKDAPTVEVMKSTYAPSPTSVAGAMVVHGIPHGEYSNMQPMGFGIGAQMYQQNQYQQQQYYSGNFIQR